MPPQQCPDEAGVSTGSASSVGFLAEDRDNRAGDIVPECPRPR